MGCANVSPTALSKVGERNKEREKIKSEMSVIIDTAEYLRGRGLTA